MRRHLLAAAAALAALAAGATAPAAGAEGTASWRLEQPPPPPPPPGQSAPSAPVPLGTIGDIEFWEPAAGAPQANRGLLITHGNGDVVPPGVWAYNGSRWHEIAEVCGASDGRIAWSGPADFWTVSDQRPGQAAQNGFLPPLKDRSLCHFGEGRVLASYARLAFEADSYRELTAAACVPPQPPASSSSDCWFGGEALAAPTVGSFHLYWNGSTLAERPYSGSSDPVVAMRALEERIFESAEYSRQHANDEEERPLTRPPVLHLESGGGEFEPVLEELPLYESSSEPTEALRGLRLGSSEGVLWAAAGPSSQTGQVTILRRQDGLWSQVRGGSAGSLPPVLADQQEEQELLGGPARNAEVVAIAPEPGGEDAWLALARPGGAGPIAVLVRISAQGEVLGAQTLPSVAERALPTDPAGAVSALVCPGREDCWMGNVNGWLYHLSPEGERSLPTSELPGFPEGRVVTERPHDEGIPQEVLDAPPPDTSGLKEEPPNYGGTFAETEAKTENLVTLPLVSRVHSRLVKGATLELSFHLAVKASVQLVAKRHKKVIAKTAKRTLKGGNHTLSLRLNPKRWPTNLSLQTHALAKLPVVSSVGGPGANINSETTGELVLPRSQLLEDQGLLP